ncbi:hypothetical protein ILUMI_12309 [Ignelater luminosus]|uniref:ZAD domain-containing protein n=1 Tax=Ignelater luminosus TaxID=2038154 RepID=A0A8K0CZT9_IGNLU|nr:hypothetical protein ILUMI_12309 [Ignelater luminosus]
MLYLVDFCRLCLNFQGEFIDMCNDDIMEKVIACINGLEFDEKLPSLICDKCLEQLDNFFDFRNRCLQSEFLINRYIGKLQSANTANKFTLTKLKVDVLQNFGRSDKHLDNVKMPRKDLGNGLNDRNITTANINLQFPQFSSMCDNLQNSIFSEDEDDIFLEEEEDEYETSQTQDNTKSLINNKGYIEQKKESNNINSIIENNQQNKLQLDDFDGLDNLCGVQTNIMERVKLQKRQVRIRTQEDKLPAPKHIGTSKESLESNNTEDTTNSKDEINDTKQLEQQTFKNNVFIYSVDEGTIHSSNLDGRVINLNHELNQLKYNLLSYLKRNPLGTRCLSKINLIIDSVICNFKDKLKNNFEHDYELEGFNNLNMFETPEAIISKYKDINKLEDVALDNNYKDTIPKEINLVKSQDLIPQGDNVSQISAFDTSKNKCTPENATIPNLCKTQTTTMDIEDNLATHVVFNKNLVNVTPKMTSQKSRKKPVSRSSLKVNPVKLTQDETLKYSIYTAPRSNIFPYRSQSTSPILKSLLVSTDNMKLTDNSSCSNVLVTHIEALADHDYAKRYNTVENDINPMKSVSKPNVEYNNEPCISTPPRLSISLNYQNDTSLMTSPSSSSALNSQDEMCLGISLKYNQDSFTGIYNNIEAKPVEDFSLFEEDSTMVDSKAIIIENVDVLQDLNMPYQNKNDDDNLYLNEKPNEETYPSTNTNSVLIGTRKNNRLQEIVESAKYKIRKKKQKLNFLYDDPLNILKTWTKRRRKTTKMNKRKKSGIVKRNVHVIKNPQPLLNIDTKKPPIKEDSDDSEIDVVTVSDQSQQVFQYYNNLQKNEAERSRRQEIRASAKILNDSMFDNDKLTTDAPQNLSLSQTVSAARKCIHNLNKEDESNNLELIRLSIKQNELQRRLDFLLGYDR